MQIQRDISSLMVRELAERIPGMVTFTYVKLSNDLRQALVYYSYLGPEDNRPMLEEFFLRERRRIRSQVGKGLHIRHIPELDFKFDASIERGMRIEQLLEDIHKDDGEDRS